MIAAIIQDSPIINQKSETIQKTLDLIEIASNTGADLIVFGETWLCGYPVWLDICSNVAIWDHEPVKTVWSEMYNSAIDISNGDLELIQKAAKAKKNMDRNRCK
ncbi:MAG: nitrilase-related carbon-nitrogen hydrolase [Saprospiraceae bacterium]|nr:nitrilase-related carbon-nitrogen hydrolase [Saprospiraceae bacterium]